MTAQGQKSRQAVFETSELTSGKGQKEAALASTEPKSHKEIAVMSKGLESGSEILCAVAITMIAKNGIALQRQSSTSFEPLKGEK